MDVVDRISQRHRAMEELLDRLQEAGDPGQRTGLLGAVTAEHNLPGS